MHDSRRRHPTRWLRSGLRLLMSAALAGGGATAMAAQETAPMARFSVRVRVDGAIRQGALATVVIDLTAVRGSPATDVRLALSPGLSAAGGPLAWQRSLGKGEAVRLAVPIRFDSAGIERLAVSVSDTTPVADEAALVTDDYAGLYLAVGRDKGFADPELTARFVAPARRALPRLLNARDPELPAADRAIAPGEVRYGQIRAGRPARAVGRALRSIDAMGVEAIFEDSAAQVSRITAAQFEDRSGALRAPSGEPETQTLPGAMPAPAVTAAALSCPAMYVERTGYTYFFNDSSQVNERLPNVLVYASSAIHTAPGNTITFRTGSDGSYDVCLPYDLQGFTYITIFQDLGPIRVFRDGASPPSTFPLWYDATWDLVHSPTVPMNLRHGQVSFALATFYKAINNSYSIFTARRGTVDAWYYTDTDLDKFCTAALCAHPNTIYIHPRAPNAGGGSTDAIYSKYGRFGKAHEYGHAYDKAILGEIGGSCSGDHTIDGPNNVGCAVQEGWADFFSFITLPDVAYRNAETFTGAASRGPEIERTFAGYLFDLIDNSNFPLPRTPAADDDPVSVSPDYLIQILKTGRTNYSATPQVVRAVQEVVALVDDVTPVPGKSQFNGYIQPTALLTRVTRPATITVAQNRALWLKNIFNVVETPPAPVVVTATVPGSIKTKATYPITGSATGGTGGYSGWRWDRCDDPPCTYTLWANAQNSSFIAYAGDYIISWQLRAQDGAGQVDTDIKQTHVCTLTTGCGPELLVASGDPKAESVSFDAAATPGRTGLRHFGAGPWLSVDGDPDSLAVTFFSLSGEHADVSLPGRVPNGLDVTAGAATRHQAKLGGKSAALDEVRASDGTSQASVIELRAQVVPRQAGYYLSYAADPDLGSVPEDDRLEWTESTGTVVVSDPSAGAIAYAWLRTDPAERPTLVEYASVEGLREPGSSQDAYLDQRHATRLVGRPGDVRFVLNRGPLTADAAGRISGRLIVARATTASEAAALVSEARLRLEQPGGPESATARVEASTFGLHQSLRRGISASVSGTSAASAGSIQMTRQQLREEGITALDFSVGGTAPAEVRVRIFSSRGQLVRELLKEPRAPGDYHLDWDRLNQRGERVPPGVYTAVMDAAGFHATRKLVVTP